VPSHFAQQARSNSALRSHANHRWGDDGDVFFRRLVAMGLGHRVAPVVLWFVFVVAFGVVRPDLPGSALEVTLDDLAHVVAG
jgi:hypothetical protein